jgi:hypothetical protein
VDGVRDHRQQVVHGVEQAANEVRGVDLDELQGLILQEPLQVPQDVVTAGEGLELRRLVEGTFVGLADLVEVGVVAELLQRVASGRRAGLGGSPENGVAQRPRNEVRSLVRPCAADNEPLGSEQESVQAPVKTGY